MTPKIFERIYIELKREVTSGRYMPGQRLQARSLADTLRTSTSPLTHAMRQLIGENVLEYSAQDGFIVPRVTERRLRDQYVWCRHLTSIGLSSASSNEPSPLPPPGDTEIIGSTEHLFGVIAATAGNLDLTQAMANISDRLRATRLLEGQLFVDCPVELTDLIELWNAARITALRRALTAYHQRRLTAVPQLLSLSYQDRTASI
ncbi:GntR family transcriptional regulator [Asticcacaulis sp.]|uniref:GntR family transcriptional regulator n=1 Tax=Asticcacaulis sp. TaxID=1872648 RepID=UPI002D00C34E|nr:GntR family transcriptional regulator [Asticcacaulis sp.]HTM82191.1 GntR family transcriptional regulator [Asticcacaulis sp.]